MHTPYGCAWVGIINDAGPQPKRLQQTRTMPQRMWPRSRHKQAKVVAHAACAGGGGWQMSWLGCIFPECKLLPLDRLNPTNEQHMHTRVGCTHLRVRGATRRQVRRRVTERVPGAPRGEKGGYASGCENVREPPAHLHSTSRQQSFCLFNAHMHAVQPSLRCACWQHDE
jgi:hypothetical protein